MAAETFVVTGGQGFIGSWVVKQLLEQGQRVVVFDVKEDNGIWAQVLTPEQIASAIRVYGDIGNTEQVRKLVLEHAPRAIIHLAGLQIPTCRANPVLGATVNVIGTINVFEAAKALGERDGKPAPVVVYASSAAVIGSRSDYNPADLPLSDAHPHTPHTIYGVFKLCNEGCARIYAQDHQMKSIGLRPLTCFGVGREFGLTSSPTKAIKACLLGRDYHIPFTGPTGFSYVEDIARMFIGATRAVFDGAHVYNIRGDVITVEQFITLAATAIPETAGRITCSGNELAIMSDVDESALRALLATVPPPHSLPPGITTPMTESLPRLAALFRDLLARGLLDAHDL